MPFLPRSRRGSWLLAAAVWLAACVGWWWVLPVAPRSWQPPGSNYLLGYLSDGKTLLTCTIDQKPNGSWLTGPIRHWNIDTGEPIAESLTENDCGDWIGLSGCRRWFTIQTEAQPSLGNAARQLRLVDVSTGRRDMKFSVGWFEWAISPDGRWLVYSHADENQTILCDLESGTSVLQLPERCQQMKFASDSSLLATTTESPDSATNKFQVLKVPSGARVFELTVPHKRGYVHSFSPDGAWLLVGENPNSVVRVLEVQTGRELLHVPACIGFDVVFSADSQSLLAIRKNPSAGTWHLATLDLSSGDEVHHFELEQHSSTPCILRERNQGHNLIVYSSKEHRSAFVDRWISRIPWIGPNPPSVTTCTVQMIDRVDWKELARWNNQAALDIRVSPNGDTVATYPRQGVVQIWDIPQSKSLNWFAAGVAAFALPIALIARRRIRKLRVA
jgi:WD40 repeat protein